MKCQESPVLFIEQVLGTTSLEEFQKSKILDPIARYSRVSVRACHSVGKTWNLARVALWFLFSFKNSKVITTAPTNRQVKKLLWGEMHSAYKGAPRPLGGKLLTTELQIGPEWFAMGFTPQKEAGSDSKEQQGSSFQGFHADYIMIIFDEATGIPADVHKMAEGLMTSGKIVKWIQIANPTTRNCKFFSTFSDDDWFNVKISCFDSPNLIANGFNSISDLKREIDLLKTMDKEGRLDRIESYLKPVPHLLSAQWVVGRAYKWGFDNPLLLSKAFGEFPSNEDNVLIQLEEVIEAMARSNDSEEYQYRYIGVDVARFGEDATVMYDFHDYKQVGKKKLIKREVTEVSGEVIRLIKEGDKGLPTRVVIDETGIGSGVVDILKERLSDRVLGRNIEIVGVHFGQACDDEEDRKKFLNLKAKMFYCLAQDVKDNLILDEDEDLLSQLPTILYKYNSSGKLQIESKEDYKKRTGNKSPDDADALAMANLARYIGPKVGNFFGHSSSKTLTKSEKITDTIKRIENRIKAQKF